MILHKKKTSLQHDESGVAHLVLVGAMVAVLLIVSGLFVYSHQSKSVSLQGTLSKSSCNGDASTCDTPYTLQGSNSKTYNLKISSVPSSVSPGTQVRVTGTTSDSDSSNVNVKSIAPVNPAPINPPPSHPPTPTIQPRFPYDVTFSSMIASDTCSSADHSGPAIGDVGCDITLKNGWIIEVKHGNALNPQYTQPGSIENAPAFNQIWTGHSVDVYAQATATNQATILTASKYYVKF